MKANVRETQGEGHRGLRIATLGVLGAYLLLALYLLWRTAVLTPFSDEINWAFSWYQLKGDHDWLGYLLAPHNLNRLAWTRILLALDMGALGGTNAPLIVSGGVALGVTAAILGAQAARAAPRPLALAWGTLAAMLTLMAGNVLDASFPINVTYAHAAVFAVAAISLSEGAPRTALGWRGVGALLCAAASAFGSGAGLALFPVMAWGALRRRDWGWLAIVTVLGVVFVGLYVSGQRQGAASDALPALHDPKSALILSLNYLVLPWTRLSPHFAWTIGLAVAAAATALILARGGPQARPVERIACGFMLFSLGTAAMAGLGRAGVTDPYDVPIRYGLLVAPLQAGALILAAPWAERLWRLRPQLAHALVLTLLLGMFAQNAVLAAKVVRASDVMRGIVADYQAGRRTSQTLAVVYPTPAFADALFARMRHDGLFQHELHLKPAAPAR